MATVIQYPARGGRGSELLLIMISWVIGSGGFVLTTVGMNKQLSGPPIVYIAALGVAALLGHLIVRRLARWADPVLLPVALAINGIGLAMIYRLDLAYEHTNADLVVGYKQLITMFIGLVAFAFTLFIVRDHRQLRRFSYIFMVAAVLLLALPMIPFLGREIHGARIWISLAGVSFQPAELAKIALAIFFAGYLEYRRDSLALAGKRVLGLTLPRMRDLGPILLVWVAGVAVLVIQRDLGTALLLFGMFIAMIYVATNRPSWIWIGALLFIPVAIIATRFFSHVQARFQVWIHALDPEVFSRNYGGSGQLVVGLFGMASGGLMGSGWGQGYPQLVPYANSDFIIASLAEELGLTGIFAILLMYFLLVERGMRAALGTRDGFGKLLGSGLSFVVALQVFIVVGGVSRLIPLTGLTMPFLASGGSSLISNWIILAILARISDAARSLSQPGLKPKIAPVLGEAKE